MDIDDILAEIDDRAVPQETRDLQDLTRAWVTERSAPEILPWPLALMERVLERIHKQIELVEEQTGNTDPKANFRLIIIQTELERFKYLVRSFLRVRIAKVGFALACHRNPLLKTYELTSSLNQIDAYTLHTLTDPSTKSRLSPSEIQYATAYTTLLHRHYHSSFLSQFPTSLQRLDDSAGGISMIETPDMDKAVFVRAIKDVSDPIFVEGTDTAFEMKRGDVVVCRWSAIRALVLGGEAELI